MLYSKIRSIIYKNKKLFRVISLLFTPVRLIKEYIYRRVHINRILSNYSKLEVNDKKIFYFGIPTHNNMGDIAQTYCTEKWIKEHYPEYTLIEIITRLSFDRKLVKYMHKVMGQDDFIIFQSGYCTRENNDDHRMHLFMAKRFPNAKMIILPQTVKLQTRSEINRTKKIFGKCTNLQFITRDSKSYAYAKEFLEEDKISLFPDIVTSLIGRVETKSNRNGILVCVRNDDEKFYDDFEIDKMITELRMINKQVEKSDTNSEKSANEIYQSLETEIQGIIQYFSKFDCVITDRYHGTIFSLIANTPVIVVKTNDHKVTSAIEWFKDVYDYNAIQFAESLSKAVDLSNMIVSNRIRVNNKDFLYKQYFEKKLYNVIEK